MEWICLGLIILGVLILGFYIYEKTKGYTPKSLILKICVSILFVMVGVLSAKENGYQIIDGFIIIGLVLGLAGDVWLDLKYIYPKDDKIYTIAGFVSFGIGHIFFIVGLFLQFLGNSHFLYVLIPIAGSILFTLLLSRLNKIIKIDFKDMKWISYAYSVVLGAFALCVLSMLILKGWHNIPLILLFVGSIAFIISDAVLCRTFFVEGHEKPIDFILNYVFYYGAQFLIAFSIFFI